MSDIALIATAIGVDGVTRTTLLLHTSMTLFSNMGTPYKTATEFRVWQIWLATQPLSTAVHGMSADRLAAWIG